MVDKFKNHSPGMSGPATHAIAITASATALDQPTRVVRCNAAGTLTGTTTGGETVSLTVLAGEYVPIRFAVISACPAGTLGLY